MRPFRILAAVVGVLAASSALAAPAPPPKARTKVVVLEPQGEGVTAGILEALDDMLLTELSRRPGYEVLGSSDVKRLLGQAALAQACGGDADACVAELGGALGASLIVSTSLARLETKYLVNMKLIDSEHARVLERRSERVDANTDALATAVQRLAASLLGEPEQASGGVLPWVAMGTSGAAAAVYGVMAFAYAGAQANGDVDRANSAALGGNVAGGVAVTAALVALGLWLFDAPPAGAAGEAR